MRFLEPIQKLDPPNRFVCHDLATVRPGHHSSRLFSFSVAPGDRVAITGNNGTGKTSFLRTLAGFLAPLGGSAEVVGTQLGKMPSYILARRGLSFIGDDHGVFTSLTVREHIELATGQPYTLDTARTVLSPLCSIASRPRGAVSTLSGGERPVFGIGCALARNPRLLLADNLTQGLQRQTKRLILDRVLTACQTFNCSMIFADEDESVVVGLANRRLDMESGICSNL